jgi:hypothetical protein
MIIVRICIFGIYFDKELLRVLGQGNFLKSLIPLTLEHPCIRVEEESPVTSGHLIAGFFFEIGADTVHLIMIKSLSRLGFRLEKTGYFIGIVNLKFLNLEPCIDFSFHRIQG